MRRLTVEEVDSTAIRRMGFDGSRGYLYIEFRKGAVWQYKSVAPAVYEELQRASSKGSYFVRNIRGRYEEAELEAADWSSIRMEARERDQEAVSETMQARNRDWLDRLKESRAAVRF